MWFLSAAMLFIYAVDHDMQFLELEIQGPDQCVSVSEGFKLSVSVRSSSIERVRVLPNFTPARNGLSLRYSCSGEVSEAGDLTAEIPGEEYFVTLSKEMYIGQSFRISHRMEDSFLYPIEGLPEGSCSVVAYMDVLVRKAQNNSSPETYRYRLQSQPASLCVAPETTEEIEQNLKTLRGKADPLERLDAIRFFGSVKDTRSLPILESLLERSENEPFRVFIRQAVSRQHW